MKTPIEKIGSIFVKRDDLFEVSGVCGGKARTCHYLSQGAKGLVTAGSRFSPQINIVAHIAKDMGIPCTAHTPSGKLGNELIEAQDCGCEIIQHKAGYNSVIIARARLDAEERGFTNIPFGMECEEAVRQTASQVGDIPKEVNRIVVPIGSGMSLSGILTGLEEIGLDIPVVGIIVGADPMKRLNKYAPFWWNKRTTIEKSKHDYSKYIEESIGGIRLDPIYEAKCVEYLDGGDLFWIVGKRNFLERE